MNCDSVLSHLNAYVDGEAPQRLVRKIEEHLEACPSCRSRAEHIRRVGDVLDGLSVPPLPREFAARVMMEARGRVSLAQEKKFVFPLGWQPIRRFLEASFSMRVAACAMVFLACLLGVLTSRAVFQPGNPRTTAVDAESLEGFEWFSPTPPASLGSAYVTLAWTPAEERNRP